MMVFWYAVAICVVIVLWGSIAPDQLNNMTMAMTVFIYNQFGWYYMFVIMAMIIFSIFLMFSRFGKIKLGKEDDEPNFNLSAWCAMLVRAGWGNVLVLFT